MVDEGQIFTWGFGLLGKGPKTTLSQTPIQVPEVLFGRNELNPDVEVDQVAAGHAYLAAITNKGDLYTWGLNKTAALGLGNKRDYFFPFKVCLELTILCEILVKQIILVKLQAHTISHYSLYCS